LALSSGNRLRTLQKGSVAQTSDSNDVNSGRGVVYVTWSHNEFYLNGAIYGGYNSYNSSRSVLQGLASGNSAIVSAGVSVVWAPTLTTGLNYDGQLGRGNYSSNAVSGGVRISF
jgi:uncharacterized protein with beta-barrel porin domain